MEITLIKKDNCIIKVIIGKATDEIKKNVKELNDNPLLDGEYEYEETYSKKTLYDLQNFLLD